MLKVNTRAELRNVNLRAQAQGDEWVRAVDLKLMLVDVPLDATTTLLPDYERFYNGDNLVLQELIPFKVHHKVDNVDVTVGDFPLKGCTIKKDSEMSPKPGGTASILVTVQSAEFSDDALAFLSSNLRETVPVTLDENQSTFLDQVG